ncbi:MAG TPA: DUF373 family protein, partial [Pyrodictiaceae archaeon]|nr:DUF373 family protein [Pyrodictiaceae archaeon]
MVFVKDVMLKEFPKVNKNETLEHAYRLMRKYDTDRILVVDGDRLVGIISDEKISEQLDKIARITNAESVIVVTDGSEDEFVLPIISSRFRIDGVKRIVVKQSKTIESTYYLIKK